MRKSILIATCLVFANLAIADAPPGYFKEKARAQMRMEIHGYSMEASQLANKKDLTKEEKERLDYVNKEIANLQERLKNLDSEK